MFAKRVTVLCLGLLAACATPMRLPSEFLVLGGKHDTSSFRAVTGDDARIWMRQFVEADGGDLAFWTQVLKRDFEERGYRMVGEGDCVDAAGTPGRWLEAAVEVDGERAGYLCAIWVADRGWRAGSEITTVEFTARTEVFDARRAAVVGALGTVSR